MRINEALNAKTLSHHQLSSASSAVSTNISTMLAHTTFTHLTDHFPSIPTLALTLRNVPKWKIMGLYNDSPSTRTSYRTAGGSKYWESQTSCMRDRQQGIVGHVNNERGDVSGVVQLQRERSGVGGCRRDRRAAQRVLIVLIRDARGARPV